MLIKKFIYSNYSLNDARFPVSICNSRRVYIQECNQNIFRRTLKKIPNYEEILLSKKIRPVTGEAVVCNCYICLTGRFKGHTKNFKKKSNYINSTNGIFGSSNSTVKQKPVENNIKKKKTKVIKICLKYSERIGKGIALA